MKWKIFVSFLFFIKFDHEKYFYFVEISSHHSGGKIVIREQHFGTPSSTESEFIDALSTPVTENNLHVTKLESFNLISESHDESPLNSAGGDAGITNDMPIVKNGQSDAADKGIFNVSRIKKVELSEIPLATDICTTSARKFIIDR